MHRKIDSVYLSETKPLTVDKNMKIGTVLFCIKFEKKLLAKIIS